MSFFRNDEVESGSNKDAIISFVCSLVAIACVVAAFFLGSNILIIGGLAFVIGVVESRKGKLSEKRIYAIIAQVILLLTAIAAALWCVFTMGGAFSSLLGE